MQEVLILSSKDYNDKTYNHGDCIIINTSKSLFVFDCGSEDHAKRVIDYAKTNGYSKVIGIISHADSDHLDGFHYLHDKNFLAKIYTTLLFKEKYIQKILAYLDDKRRSTESTRNNIKEAYSNISALSGYGLEDTFDDNFAFIKIDDCIEIVGPNIEYLIEAVANNIDNTAPNSLDGNTLTNAASIIIKVSVIGKTFIFNGDASVASIIEAIGKTKISVLQLSHHGNIDREELLKKYEDNCAYFISDNTGSSNGGSAKIDTRGYNCKNTLNGDIKYEPFMPETLSKRTLGNL